MRESHSKAYSVDQLLEHSPKFRLNPGQAAQNLSEIMEKLDEIEAQKSRSRWIKWGGIICSVALALILVFYSVDDPKFLSFTSQNESLNQGMGINHSPLEPWEVSPIFQMKDPEDESLSLDVIGDPDHFGLGIEKYSVDHKGNRIPLPTYYADQGYKTAWYILRSHDEVEGKKMKVTARRYEEPEQEINLISDATVSYNELYQVGEARTFYLFPEEGLWNLRLFLEEDAVGEITIKVLPRIVGNPELGRQRERWVEEIAATFEIDLDEYFFKDFNDMINRDEYESLLIGSFMEVQRKFTERGDTIPFVYLNEKETHGYIFVRKNDGTHVAYYLENNEGQWSISDQEAN